MDMRREGPGGREPRDKPMAAGLLANASRGKRRERGDGGVREERHKDEDEMLLCGWERRRGSRAHRLRIRPHVPVPSLGLSESDKQCIGDRSCIMAQHILADQPQEYIQAQVSL